VGDCEKSPIKPSISRRTLLHDPTEIVDAGRALRTERGADCGDRVEIVSVEYRGAGGNTFCG
jgi:hypothetical protein